MGAVGLVLVAALTAFSAAYYYSDMESDMRNRASATTEFFADYQDQDYEIFYESCATYAQTFNARNQIELQFINTDGEMVTSSSVPWVEQVPSTPEIATAMNSRGIETFRGKNPSTGERIMAVSSPVIYSNGEVIGVFRFVTSTDLVDRQIFTVAWIGLLALAGAIAVVILSSRSFIRSVMAPLADITDKSKRIANGSYGIQIQAKYRDEIGDLAETINEMSSKISQNEKCRRNLSLSCLMNYAHR